MHCVAKNVRRSVHGPEFIAFLTQLEDIEHLRHCQSISFGRRFDAGHCAIFPALLNRLRRLVVGYDLRACKPDVYQVNRIGGLRKLTFDDALIRKIDALGADLVVLAGFMRILTPSFIRHFEGRLINIHPALLPAFPGLHTHERALEAGVKEHGATVYFVAEGVDEGPIICQTSVPVLEEDDSDSLAARVLKAEHLIYPRAVKWFLDGRLRIEGNQVKLQPPESQFFKL